MTRRNELPNTTLSNHAVLIRLHDPLRISSTTSPLLNMVQPHPLLLGLASGPWTMSRRGKKALLSATALAEPLSACERVLVVHRVGEDNRKGFIEERFAVEPDVTVELLALS